MKFGYARVSTQEQSLEIQIQKLKDAGCDEILSEKASGSKNDRKELNRLSISYDKEIRFVLYA